MFSAITETRGALPSSPSGTSILPVSEIKSLTTLRGFAASWVVLFHSIPLMDQWLPEAKFLRPIVEHGHLAVPLFFVLSGYVIAMCYGGKLKTISITKLFNFWTMRLGRIYPVHLATLLIALVLVGRQGWPTDDGHTKLQFVENLLLIHAWERNLHLSWNYPSWSISSEWFAYLFFPFANLFITGVSRYRCHVLFWIACTASMVAVAAEDALPFRGLVIVFPTFIGGAILANAKFRININPWWFVGGILLAPLLISSKPVCAALIVLMSFALVATLGEIGHGASAIWKSRACHYLGNISYSLYMTHVTVITITYLLLPVASVSKQSFPLRICAFTFFLSCILIVASVCYGVIERPGRDFVRRTLKRQEIGNR